MSKIVTRSQWGARAPKSTSRIVRRRAWKVHWTAGCSPLHEKCDDYVRGVQNYHMDTQGWSDIAYGELVCPHGWIYLGRGKGVRPAANGNAYLNSMHNAIAVIANENCQATPVALDALALRLQELRATRVKVHSDGYWTECPGTKITTWVNAKKYLAYEELVSRRGWFAWFAWFESEGDWHGIGRAEKGKLTRPNVPRVIPPQWWRRRKKFLARRG